MGTSKTGGFLKGTAQQRIGFNTAIFRWSASVTVSAGEIISIGKLPHGAIPLDAVFYPGSALSATSGILKFGTSASNDLFLSSKTYSTGAIARATNPLGPLYQISVSDDAVVRYEAVTAVCAAGAGVSVGWIGDLLVEYVMPGQTLD